MVRDQISTITVTIWPQVESQRVRMQKRVVTNLKLFFPPVFRWMWLRLERAGDRDQNLRDRTPPESRVHAYLVFTDNPMALLTLGGGDQRAYQKRIKGNFFISFVWESVITLS